MVDVLQHQSSSFLLQRSHRCCCRFFWCWNRNSGDTGGLVMENWLDIEWEKVTYLSLIGLRPWFLDWVRELRGFKGTCNTLVNLKLPSCHRCQRAVVKRAALPACSML